MKTVSPPNPVPLRAWVVLALCGTAGLLFYLDRQIVPVLKPSLKAELGWTDADYGWLLTAYMSCYMVFYLIAGRWVDRWGTKATMPLFLVGMSLATIAFGFGHTLPEMGGYQALLGMAEAGIMPAMLVAIVRWFPPETRGLAYTVKQPFNVIGQIGVAPMAAVVTATIGWRSAFFLPGVLGLVLALAWWWADRPPAAVAASRAGRPGGSYLALLRRRELWGLIAAKLVSDPLWFFFLYWESSYLQERLGMSLNQFAAVSWVPTLVATVVLIGSGALSDRWVAKRRTDAARSRRLILQAFACLAPAVVALRFTQNWALTIVLLCLVRTMAIVWLNFISLLLADVVPTEEIGRAAGLVSALGVATAMACNAAVGLLVAKIGYGAIFITVACLHPAAAVILWWSYGRTRRVEIASTRSEPARVGRD